MSMIRLAFLNFKNSFRNYLTLVISLAFTILVLFNFQNLIVSGAFETLGTRNREYVEIIIQVISFVLVCFMFFFIWYSTNVFLTRRKREIGIYVFMGLSNEKIGRMYLAEVCLIGISALVLGILFGALSTGLFQMILLAISDLAVEIRFRPSLKSVLVTAGIYLPIYLVFAVHGYGSIVKSSVLNMMSASRQNEYVRPNPGLLLMKSVAGVGILGMGYGLAVKKDGAGTMGNAFGAVVLVTAGVYLLFGGMIPAVLRILAKNKKFLYERQRIIWVSSMIFRMKKNYRTYAMVCILMLCSVTALATGFAMKGRYETIIQFENTYTFQLVSDREDLGNESERLIGEGTDIVVKTGIPMLHLESVRTEGHEYSANYGILAFSDIRKLAEETGLRLDFEEPGDDEVMKVSHLYLLSLITDRAFGKVEIGGKVYRKMGETSEPYLGYLQESVSFYVVNDREYERLKPLGEQLFTYNYRIGDPGCFWQTRERLDAWVAGLEGGDTARIAIDPESNELDWVKVMYSVCIFMFLVFVLASGSILFMKLYNDGFEEKERYGVLLKMGADPRILKRSIRTELMMSYGLPFAVMGISSFFSVGALASMMFTSLIMVNVVSVAVVFVILTCWYLLSVRAYERNVGISGGDG